jgi:hypothetical protein
MNEDHRLVAGMCGGMLVGVFFGWVFSVIIGGDKLAWEIEQHEREQAIERGCFDVMGELHCPKPKPLAADGPCDGFVLGGECFTSLPGPGKPGVVGR